MSDLSPETLGKIESARTVFGRPSGESMVPYASILALLAAQTDRLEDKPFLVFYSDEGARREQSYREFYEEVVRTSMYLLAAGILPGDRVATVSFNHSDVLVQYFAAWAIGACVVPVNTGEDDRRIAFILQDSGVKLALVRDQYLDRMLALRANAPALTRIVQVGAKSSRAFPHLGTEVELQPARLKAPRAPELRDEALLVYTSGTTGNPKGVVLDQYNLLVDAMSDRGMAPDGGERDDDVRASPPPRQRHRRDAHDPAVRRQHDRAQPAIPSRQLLRADQRRSAWRSSASSRRSSSS